MSAPTITYTLTNGSTADADQVQQNLNDLLNGITDGTKDLTINSLTMNGNFAVYGNATFGNGSIDTITFTGSLASSIALSSDGAYDIGSATAGLRYVYFGDASGDTVRVGVPTLAADYNLTLPPTDGNAGDTLRSDGSGTLVFAPAPNYGLAASISSLILTVALKGADGNDPSSSNPVDIPFRSTTATTGTVTKVAVTSATSLTIGTAVSLGLLTATSGYVYIYALNNAGTVELFASLHNTWDEFIVQSTSTTGTSNAVLYGANARSNMSVKLLGRVKATWTNASGWSSLANVDVGQIPPCFIGCSYSSDTATAVTDGNGLAYEDRIFDSHNAYTSSGTTFTCPAAGVYRVTACSQTANVATGGTNVKFGLVIDQTGSATVKKRGQYDCADASVTRSMSAIVSAIFNCAAGDALQITFTENIPAVNLSGSGFDNWLEVQRIG